MVKDIVLLLVMYGLEGFGLHIMAPHSNAAIKQAVKDLTMPRCTNEEIATFVAPYQVTVQNLTRIVERLTAPTSHTTMTPVPACTVEIAGAVTCQETVRNLTTIVAQLTASTNTPAPVPRCDCDEQVAPCQQFSKNMTETLAEMTCDTCVSGYEYSNTTGHCYKLHTEKVLWTVANSTCHGEGGHLAVINSLEESRVLSGINRRANEVCFIGIFRDSYDHWTTVTGEDVDAEVVGFDVWDSSEPWKGEKWRYGMLYDNGMYATTTGESESKFICERAAA